MKVFIVYCHPSEDSFTKKLCDSFIQGVVDSGNEYVLSDLYKMNFQTDMSEKEYLRDAYYQDTSAQTADVLEEQRKINESDALVFIYPVFWTEAPAKLVGWFDRVWTYGFAYGEKRMKFLDKALILCVAGNKINHLETFGQLQSMKKVMLGDRLFERARSADFIIFDEMTRESIGNRKANWNTFLEKAHKIGKELFIKTEKKFSLDGKYFKSVENSASGEVDAETIFAYRQKNDIVWGEYGGGKILKGTLIGKLDSFNHLSFSYQHINTENELKSGTSTSIPQILENGKLRLLENWQWTTGEKGTSVIEQM